MRARIVAAVGLHRKMQHQFVPLRSRRLRLLAQFLGVRQERHGHGSRQFPGPPRARPVEAYIVDHNRDQGTAVEVTKRHRIAPPGLFDRCRGRDLLRFGGWLPRLLAKRGARLAGLCLGVLRKVGQIFEACVFRLKLAGRRGSAALHVFERIARCPIAIRQIESLRQPVAPEKTADKHQHDGRDDRMPAMSLDPREEPAETPAQTIAQPRRRLRTPSVRLPASVLPRRHIKNSP